MNGSDLTENFKSGMALARVYTAVETANEVPVSQVEEMVAHYKQLNGSPLSPVDEATCRSFGLLTTVKSIVEKELPITPSNADAFAIIAQNNVVAVDIGDHADLRAYFQGIASASVAELQIPFNEKLGGLQEEIRQLRALLAAESQETQQLKALLAGETQRLDAQIELIRQDNALHREKLREALSAILRII